MGASSILDKVDWPNILVGVLIPILLSFLYNSIKLFVQHRKASSDLKTKIQGIWYSAEFDHKNSDPIEARNTYLKVKLKRKFGNRVVIEAIGSEDSDFDKAYPTGWVVEGKLVGTNLMCEWYSTIPGTIRYGNAFLEFLDNGITVGYWIGVSLFPRPMYGYWIMARDLDEVKRLSKTALLDYDFHAYDIAYLIENISKKIPADNVKI